MWRAWSIVFVIACGSEPATKSPVENRTPGSSAPAPYSGPAETGPCESAHDCVLRDECGCSCKAVVLSAPKQVACEESCPNPNACEGHTVICVLDQRQCSALPKGPPSK